MSRFDLSQYETVDERIHKFWQMHPNGRILTHLVHFDETQFIVKAEVYTDRDDSTPAASDYAEERVGTSPVNRTSALENCSTSAIGRCLSTLGLSKQGARPSQTEMQKAERVDIGLDAGTFNAFQTAMNSAINLAMLNDIAGRAKDAGLSTAQRNDLRELYVINKERVTAAEG
jgi:hypothetical protein